MKLVDQLLVRVESGELPPPRSTLVVAVSGGVDSMSLLHLLLPLSSKYNWRLVVAHLNHQLRKEANRDEAWVKSVGQRLGLLVVTARVSVRTLAKRQRYTLEEAGRVARYQFLVKVARRYRARTIVVAHTVDDQVETITMNWLRGAGISGLAGMSEWQPLAVDGHKSKGVTIWRPLLRVVKADLKQLSKTLHFGYREDKTNRQVVFTRNRIRQQILPMLRRVNPRVDEAILRNAENLSGLEELLSEQIAKSKKLIRLRRGRGSVSFRSTPFNKLSTYLQNELLLWCVGEVLGNRRNYRSVHLSEMKKVVNSRGGRSYRQLPGKLFLIKAYDKISVSRFKPKDL